MTPTFEPASAADLDLIRALLAASELPVDDVHEHVAEFIVGRQAGELIGSVAAEYAGTAALLRSLCVAPRHRGQAVAARLLSALEARAAARGVRELYLLTTSAARYFEQRGFFETSRDAAPEGIRATAQFRTLCPATAVCMRKTLPPSADTYMEAP